MGIATLFDRMNYNEIPTGISLTILLGAVALGLAVARRPIAGPLAVLFGLVFAIRERIDVDVVQNSDVLRATNEAIRVLAAGGNPYSHSYQDTIPPGSPFPYPIGEPVYYWLHREAFGSTDHADTVAGILILLIFVALVPIIGWVRSAVAVMGYGISATAVRVGADGSNDTSLALLVILSLTLLLYSVWDRTPDRLRDRLLVASALAFAWALLFKLFAVVIFPFIIVALWRRRARWKLFTSTSVSVAVLAMLPFLIDDFSGVIDYISRGGAHDLIFGFNVWSVLRHHAPDLVATLEPHISFIQITIGGLVGLALLTRVRSDIGVATSGGLVTLVTLVGLANWTSGAYYVGFWAIVIFASVTANVPSLALQQRPSRRVRRRANRAGPRLIVVRRASLPQARMPPAARRPGNQARSRVLAPRPVSTAIAPTMTATESS